MKNISCSIVEDLLPLYMENICSVESKELIENHMKDCIKCQEKFDRLEKSSLSIGNAEENLDQGTTADGVSDACKKKTGLDIKASVFSLIFYVAAIGALLIIQSMGEKAYQAYLRFEIKYILVVMAIELAIWLMLGALIAFIGSRPKNSRETFILELIVIGIPSLFMVASMFIASLMPMLLQNFIIQNATIITTIGVLLLGCEMFRCFRMKN
jgi:hypothetical protein